LFLRSRAPAWGGTKRKGTRFRPGCLQSPRKTRQIPVLQVAENNRSASVFLKSNLPVRARDKTVRNCARAAVHTGSESGGSGSRPSNQWCHEPIQKPGSEFRAQNSGDDLTALAVNRSRSEEYFILFRDSALPSLSFDAAHRPVLRSRVLYVCPTSSLIAYMPAHP